MSGSIPSGVSRKDLERAIHLTFRAARRNPRGSLGVAFVSNARIERMNRTYRGLSRPTDVLSFEPANMPAVRGVRLWGDIVLAPTVIRKEARTRSISFREELLRDLIHGVLHLFGYDHMRKLDEKKMFTLQERVLHQAL